MILTALLGTPAVSFACKSAGPNKHVGIVLSVIPKDHLLTLRDAETGETMRFRVAEQLAGGIRSDQQVVITFEMSGKEMVATKIQA